MLHGVEGIVIAAALLSAFLHAAWNAAVKASSDPQGAMAAQVVASGIISAVAFIVVPLPPMAALPWLGGSTAFNFVTLLALLRGYRSGGGFGLVYPLARATAPPLVLILTSTLQGEAVGALGVAGIIVVSSGVALFAFGESGRPAAVAYALLAGALSAVYALCDGNGARASASVLSYGLAVSVVNALIFGTFHCSRNAVSPLAALRAHAGIATIGAAAALTSYALILWVWSRAPIALGAALRDTSVVFAALLAMRLGERLTLTRIGAIALVTGGACAIRFA
jgi:drug/metabolite transporter (DMT)-like permease